MGNKGGGGLGGGGKGDGGGGDGGGEAHTSSDADGGGGEGEGGEGSGGESDGGGGAGEGGGELGGGKGDDGGWLGGGWLGGEGGGEGWSVRIQMSLTEFAVMSCAVQEVDPRHEPCPISKETQVGAALHFSAHSCNVAIDCVSQSSLRSSQAYNAW